jgi:hypothetical protein
VGVEDGDGPTDDLLGVGAELLDVFVVEVAVRKARSGRTPTRGTRPNWIGT